jgi:hypothetical protein
MQRKLAIDPVACTEERKGTPNGNTESDLNFHLSIPFDTASNLVTICSLIVPLKICLAGLIVGESLKLKAGGSVE